MAFCKQCKYFTVNNKQYITDKGFCQIWDKWQNSKAENCKYFE